MINNLASVFVRELWTSEDIKESTELKNFARGRHIVSSPLIAKAINGIDSGQTVEIPYIRESEYEEASIGDDSDDEIVAGSLSKDKDRAYMGFYNRAFGEYDIVNALGSGIDPLQAAVSLFGSYWDKQLQRRIIYTIKGIKASNIANNTSDLILDKKEEVLSYDLVLDTLALLGDAGNGFVSVFAHSAVVYKMKKSNDVVTVVDSERGLTLSMYNGLDIIENDLFTPTYDSVLGKNIYTLYFLKAGAFVYEMSTKVQNPIVYVRDEKAGKGSGKTEVISRVGYLLHPQGYNFKLNSAPSDAVLTAATTWERNSTVKESKIVFLDCQI